VNSLKKVGFFPIQNKGRVWPARAPDSAGGGLRGSLGSVGLKTITVRCSKVLR
jgi:hypothetical protein